MGLAIAWIETVDGVGSGLICAVAIFCAFVGGISTYQLFPGGGMKSRIFVFSFLCLNSSTSFVGVMGIILAIGCSSGTNKNPMKPKSPTPNALCTEGATGAKDCRSGAGTQATKCVNGEWAPDGLCTPKSGVCWDGEVETSVCAEDPSQTKVRQCVDGGVRALDWSRSA